PPESTPFRYTPLFRSSLQLPVGQALLIDLLRGHPNHIPVESHLPQAVEDLGPRLPGEGLGVPGPQLGQNLRLVGRHPEPGHHHGADDRAASRLIQAQPDLQRASPPATPTWSAPFWSLRHLTVPSSPAGRVPPLPGPGIWLYW